MPQPRPGRPHRPPPFAPPLAVRRIGILLGALLLAALPAGPGTARDRLPDPAALGALALIPHPAAGLVHPGLLVHPGFGLGALHGGIGAHGALAVFGEDGAVIAIGAGSGLHAHPFGLRHGIRVFRPAAHVPLVLAGGPAVVPGVPGRYEERAVGEGRYQIRSPAGGVGYQVRDRGASSPGYEAQPLPVGRVVVDVEPAEAEVWLNGRKLASESPGHFEWSLVEGRYPVEVRAPGRREFRREVVVEPGRHTELRVVLEPEPLRRSGR